MKLHDELKLMMPGEKAIIFNPDSGVVHFTDFQLIAAPADGEIHVHHVLGGAEYSDVHLVASVAMGRPGEMVESDCMFRGKTIHMRVIHAATPEPKTCVFIMGA